MRPLRSILATLFLLCGSAFAAEEPATTPATSGDSGGISPEAVGIIIAAVLGAGGGSYVLGRSHTVKVAPQPLEVKTAHDYATREELNSLRKYIDGEVRKISERIDKLTPAISEIKGMVVLMNQNQEKILSLLLQSSHDKA